MKSIFVVVLCFLILIQGQKAWAQDEFFHEIAIEKKLKEKEKWELTGEATFKHLYDQPAWSRWGISFAGAREIKRFKVSGGFNALYTFNRDITNFFEIRPWTALSYNFPLVKFFTLRQRLKYEWRFFFTDGDNATKENYGRLRYQIGIDIPIKSEEETSWKIRPSFEWFFIRKPADFERFSNERDFRLMAIKRCKNEYELSFGVTREIYYKLNSEPQFGYLFLVAYTF